jgi:hypothetical protein
MPPFKVVPCTLDDAPAIARNNICAFWEEKHWALIWTRKNKTRDYVISQSVHRWPYNLTKDPIFRRREKVVDMSTGELVGFASWKLPVKGMAGEDEDEARMQEIGEMWPEARVPEVDDETRELLKKKYDEADWEFDHTLDDALDPALSEFGAKLRGDQKWLSKYSQLIMIHIFSRSSNSTFAQQHNSPRSSCRSSRSSKTRYWLAPD